MVGRNRVKGNAGQPDIFIGWDVGGWDCDRNPRSRDALVVLDSNRQLIGEPWRGNLRRSINGSCDSKVFLSTLLGLCSIPVSGPAPSALIAIDAPLAFPARFAEMVNGMDVPGRIWASSSNPYIYRETERFLISHGHRPLSPVKDMIGSQATKAQHVVRRFAPELLNDGVWTDKQVLTVIEAYPSVAHKSPKFNELREQFIIWVNSDAEAGWPIGFDHSDQVDALSCALVGWLFVHSPTSLAQPAENIPLEEGWIWVPEDALGEDRGILVRH